VKNTIITTTILSTTLLASQNFNTLKFDGLTQIAPNVAIETLKLNNKHTLSDQDIDNLIKKLYQFDYFNDIWVTNENKILTIHVKEKPFISKIFMKGYKTRDDELKLLYDTMGIHKGTMYTKQKIKYAKRILLLALKQEGYINSVVEVNVKKLNDKSVTVHFDINKGDPIIIKHISYNGAKYLEQSDFEDVIQNKEEDCCFTWFFGRNDGEMQMDQLQFDSPRIKDLYYQHGFLDAKVSAAFSKIDFNTNNANIEYNITEGKQYKVDDIKIYIDKDIVDIKTLYPKLFLEKGKTFNIKKLRQDQQIIQKEVANKGYAYAVANFKVDKDIKTNNVSITYNVISGDKVYINDVIISGNDRTLDRVIRRDIYLAPQDLFNLTDYTDSLRKLKQSGFFEDVKITKKRVSKNKMDLLVHVKEAATGNLVFGGGYGSYDGWMINASINDKNIFGSGMNLGFSVDYSKRKTNYNISLFNPSIRDSKYSGSVNLYKKTTEIIAASDSTEGDQTTYQTGLGLGIGKAITRYARVGINYNFDDETIEYDIDKSLNEDFISSSLTPYISYNSTDNYYVPRHGIKMGTSLKYTGVGGDAKYVLSSSYFKYFYSLERLTDYDIIFRYKNSVKYLKDTGYLPDDTTFYLGGPSSLRGYESYAFQPDDSDHPFMRYFTNSIELSFPLIASAKMRWGLFFDHGMIGETNFDEISRSGYGEFVSWISPFGPIQFIFGNAINPKNGDKTSNFEFNIGGSF